MTTLTLPTEAELQQMTEEREARIRRALDAGGLPTEAEVEAVEHQLQAAFDSLEDIAGRIKGIAGTEVGDELPSVISLGEIGTVAVLVGLLDRYVDDYRQMAMKMRDRIAALASTGRRNL
jgi:hypothetical protein